MFKRSFLKNPSACSAVSILLEQRHLCHTYGGYITPSSLPPFADTLKGSL